MIKEFKVGASHTVNMGNYNSMRIEAEVVWVMDEMDEDAMNESQIALETLLKQTFERQSKPVWLDQARKSRIA